MGMEKEKAYIYIYIYIYIYMVYEGGEAGGKKRGHGDP
jgi:hypothetical protein